MVRRYSDAKAYGKKSPIHMVSAWACKNNLVLGQAKADQPQLLKHIQDEFWFSKHLRNIHQS